MVSTAATLVRLNSIPVTRVDADRGRDVVDQGGDGADAVLPLEAEPQIDQHAEQRDQDGPDAVDQQLLADPRADELGALVAEAAAQSLVERTLDPLDRLPLRRLVALGRLGADHHLVVGAGGLQRDLAEVELVQGRAHQGEVGRPRGAHLEQHAALEVDAEIEALGRRP